MRHEPVYRRRRAVALVILIVVIALLIWLVNAIAGLFSSDEDAPSSEQKTAASQEEQPTAGAPASCDAQALDLAVATEGSVFSIGKSVTFVVSVSSNAQDPCLVNASDKERVLTIRSGKDQIWSSADCAADEPRELLMSQGNKDSQTIVWKTERSNSGCDEDLPDLRPGTYRAQVTLGKAESEELVFTLQ